MSEHGGKRTFSRRGFLAGLAGASATASAAPLDGDAMILAGIREACKAGAYAPKSAIFAPHGIITIGGRPGRWLIDHDEAMGTIFTNRETGEELSLEDLAEGEDLQE